MRKKPIIIVLLVVAVLLSVRGYLTLSKIDRSGPAIRVSNNVITYKEGDSYTTLLSDVSAIDEQDGDVSDTLMVEKVRSDDKKKQAVVTYAAIDKKNNLTKVNRVVQYVPDEKKATAEPTETPTPTETPAPTAAPSQTTSETPVETETPSPMILGKAPIIYLKSDKITVKQNEKFSVQDFIAHVVDDKDEESTVVANLKYEGSYNINRKGSYELTLYVTDSDGNVSNRETVTLVVK